MSNHDDPFFNAGGGDEDRTVIRPTPGGRRPPGSPPPAAPTPQPPPMQPAPSPTPAAAAPRHAAPAPVSREELGHTGLNPLVTAAAPLLTLVGQLRNTMSHPDPDGLRQRTVDEVKGFETAARSRGISPEVTLSARYVLCSLIDEAVLGTPWGSESVWSKQGLLITFHKEAWGGEKFFQLLDHLLQDPTGNLQLLELMYLCLTQGFRGRYSVQSNGQAALDELRERLYRVLRQQRGEFERELSPHWHGVTDRRNPLIRHVPLWVLGAVAAALLTALYFGFSFALNSSSDPVFAALHGVGSDASALFARPVAVAEPPPAPVAAPKGPTLKELLSDEIQAGVLDVNEAADHSTVILHGDGLFASGSVDVKPDYIPILGKVAAALKQVPGLVLITGHTDDVPIHNLRFPSNWHLSQRRADAVLAILGRDTGTPNRFTAEGRADTEPLVPNDSRENRARNRRVEITLIGPRGNL